MTRVLIPAPAERRIRREARSATMRERALALHRTGWTLARIGEALGVSTPRAMQLVHQAKRLLSANETGTTERECPFDSNNGSSQASLSNITDQVWLPATKA